MDKSNLLEKYNKLLNEHIKTMEKLNLAMKMIIRIRKTYPHIFGECIIEEEMNKLCE